MTATTTRLSDLPKEKKRPGRPRKAALAPGEQVPQRVVSAQVEEWQRQALEGYAAGEGISLSEVVRLAVGEFLEGRGL